MASARAAITESDNSAILALFSALEADKGGLLGASAYATSLLRGAGDNDTRVTTAPPPPGYATTFGQTPWTPTAEVTFFRALALGCVLPPADTNFELGLMGSIEASESFGLGSAGFQPGRIQGGLGPGAHRSIWRPSNRDHRHRRHRGCRIAHRRPRQHIHGWTICARPDRPVATLGNTTDPTPHWLLPGMNSNGRDINTLAPERGPRSSNGHPTR